MSVQQLKLHKAEGAPCWLLLVLFLLVFLDVATALCLLYQVPNFDVLIGGLTSIGQLVVAVRSAPCPLHPHFGKHPASGVLLPSHASAYIRFRVALFPF